MGRTSVVAPEPLPARQICWVCGRIRALATRLYRTVVGTEWTGGQRHAASGHRRTRTAPPRPARRAGRDRLGELLRGRRERRDPRRRRRTRAVRAARRPRGAPARLRPGPPPGRARRRRPVDLETSPTSCSPAPSRSSTCSTPSSTCGTSPRHGHGTDMTARWARRRCDELDDGRLAELLRALRRHEDRDEARRCIDYIRRNRMRYPAFRARGLCVTSGTVEAGCKKRRRNPLQTARHALVRGRRQRHGRPALLRPQPPPRRLLDPPKSPTRRLRSNKFVVRPRTCLHAENWLLRQHPPGVERRGLISDSLRRQTNVVVPIVGDEISR